MEAVMSWHRKWVVLLAALGWLFLYRYRVMGWLLSKAITFQMSKSRDDQLTVQVERVSLQPLKFLNVEINCSGPTSWRVVLTSVKVENHVKEFFESFGLVKICVLVIDEIAGDVAQVDEQTLQELLLPKRARQNATTSTKAKMNPICFARFVDLRVEKIRLRVNCLEVVAELKVKRLFIGVKDVLVQRKMFQLQVQVSSVMLQSFSQSQRHSQVWNDLVKGHEELESRNGFLLAIPDTEVLFDLNLMNQRFLGCQVLGSKEKSTDVFVASAFIERVLTVRNTIILKSSAGSTDIYTDQDAGRSQAVAITPTAIEITGFQIRVAVVVEVDSIGSVPIQFCASIDKYAHTKPLAEPAASSDEVAIISDAGEARTNIEATFQNVSVDILGDSETKLLAVTSCGVDASQTTSDSGIAHCSVGSVDCFLNHRSETICLSLMEAQKRMEALHAEVKAMLHPKTDSNVPSRKRIIWDTEVALASWTIAFEANSNANGKDELTAYGTETSIQSPLFPTIGDDGSSVAQRSVMVEQIRVEVTLYGQRSHVASFGGAVVTTTITLDSAQSSKLNSGSFIFDYISVNELLSESNADFTQFPAVYLDEVKIKREQKTTSEFINVDLDVHIDQAKVKWGYQQHKAFLLEWVTIKDIIDQLDCMLSGSSSRKKKLALTEIQQSGSSSQDPLKNETINVYSKQTVVDVADIPGVTTLAAFCLEDAKASHRVTQLSIISGFNCVTAHLSWGDETSTIEMADASFQNRKSLGRQRYLAKVPAQSNIRFSRLKMHLRPQSRMLLLFLRLDQLVNSPQEKEGDEKRVSAQGISFACGIFAIDLEGDEQKASIMFTTLGVKMTRSNLRDITETLVRIASCLGKQGIVGRSFVDVAHQVVVMEGTASASTITAAIPAKTIVELQDTQIHFSLTDVGWCPLLSSDRQENGLKFIPRSMGFDVSMLTAKIKLAMERKLIESLLATLPIFQQGFDTREDVVDELDKPQFRQRYAGNFDVAFQESDLVYPYGSDIGRERIGNKIMRVLVGDVALKLRQFRVLELRCSPLRIILEDAVSTENDGFDQADDSLQLLFIPEAKLHCFINWKTAVEADQQEYSLSLDISLGNTAPIDHPAQVPLADEALVALNWDCVYPWLIYIATDDDENVDRSTTTTSTERNVDKGIQCVGVQWDLCITLIQMAWWDMATQDTGMLVVAKDFLSHGILKIDDSTVDSQEDIRPSWMIWETSIYLHSFRGYLLRMDEEFKLDDSPPALGALPFVSEMHSNFSLEMLGTSYRNTYTPADSEDWEALDDKVMVLFGPSNSTLFEKMHDEFAPIDHEFSIDTPPKVTTAPETTQRLPLPLLHVPVSIRSSASISPPRSPRAAKNGAQSIRNKLSRLKRRSASMDNLFLKDGSCPIQVDSMRLLWTIQTRDSIFYMVSTTLDSVRLIVEAKQRTNCPDGQPDTRSLSPQRKRNSFQSASLATTSPTAEESEQSTTIYRGFNRRGSTRDTLLDLLHQGKLGMAQDPECTTSNGGHTCDQGPQADTTEYDVSKTIAVKTYTLDVHDAQINIREEGTRSNMLLASKHIHFEIGSDASDNNTIANLTFDNVTAHVAPIDVDISAGVLWYSHSGAGSPSSSGSALLKQIMEECSLTSTYTHNLVTEATSTEVDLSFLQLSTDRHQFYQLLNVIRHVLLAPPNLAKRPKQTYTPKTNPVNPPESPQPAESGEIMIFVPPSPTSTAISTSAKKLHVLLEEELRNREIRTRGTSSRLNAALSTLKAISFKVVGMQWRLRLSPEIAGADHEFMEMRIQGFTGCHTYHTNHCTKLTLNLQWLEVNNLHPGPSTAPFEDPMAVLKAKLLVDKRFESASKLGVGNQKGMLVLRAESGPIVRVLGQKLRVLEVLEVSMFPEVSNMIVIQLAADFYELIYKFLFENTSPDSGSSHNMNSEHVLFGRKGSTSPAPPFAGNAGSVSNSKGSSSPYLKTRPSTTATLPQSTLRPLHKTHSIGSGNSLSESSFSLSASGPNSPTASSTEELSFHEDNDSTADNCELFYVKYVRVGNVRLRINCNGFFVSLSHFDLELPPYICQSKLCTTKKLLQKFESHLKWYVTKESASSGLSQFKNKLLKWTPSSSSASDKKDKNKKQEEDTAAANAQVLFGPYSGTST